MYISSLEGEKSIAKLDGGHGLISPWIRHWMLAKQFDMYAEAGVISYDRIVISTLLKRQLKAKRGHHLIHERLVAGALTN